MWKNSIFKNTYVFIAIIHEKYDFYAFHQSKNQYNKILFVDTFSKFIELYP